MQNVCITLIFSLIIHVKYINPLNAELNPICHLLALLGAHTILHVSKIRVKLLQINKDRILCIVRVLWATRWRSWLRHCATSRKVAGSIPDGVIGIFH